MEDGFRRALDSVVEHFIGDNSVEFARPFNENQHKRGQPGNAGEFASNKSTGLKTMLPYRQVRAITPNVSVRDSNPSGGFEHGSDVTETLYSGSHEPIGEFNDHSYLTTDKSIAGKYGKHVAAAKVNVKNVFRPSNIQEVAEETGIPHREEHRFTFEELDRHAVRQALMDKGYDAVHFQDIAPNSPGDKTHDALIVFHGKNIKNVTKPSGRGISPMKELA